MPNESSSSGSYLNFDEFWREYLNQHQHPANQILHVLGTLGGLVCLGLAASVSWWWLLAALPVGYGGAWFGHFLIERNRPLTFTYPLWSLRADLRLVALMLIGRRPTGVVKAPVQEAA